MKLRKKLRFALVVVLLSLVDGLMSDAEVDEFAKFFTSDDDAKNA